MRNLAAARRLAAPLLVLGLAAPVASAPAVDPAEWPEEQRAFLQDGPGLLLSLELYEHTFLGTAESSVRLIEDIGLDVVGLNPDIGNLIRLHEPFEDWRAIAEATMPYANFWHVKNYTRDEDAAAGLYSTVPTSLELGVIDYRHAVKLAVRSGFQGVICVEHYGGDGLSVSATNHEYLRRRVLPRREYAPRRSRVRQTHGAEAPA